jgi:hypothetical protein
MASWLQGPFPDKVILFNTGLQRGGTIFMVAGKALPELEKADLFKKQMHIYVFRTKVTLSC